MSIVVTRYGNFTTETTFGMRSSADLDRYEQQFSRSIRQTERIFRLSLLAQP
jgi:hypothetical protein